jgi:Flp pilus assembly pilin Flp
MWSHLLQLFRNDDGASMVEYAVIAALFAVPLLGALGALAGNAGGVLQTTGTNLTTLAVNPP